MTWGRNALALLALLLSLASCAMAQAAPARKTGYITMSDGVTLRYTAVLPAETGRFPVALKYDGYCEGTDPLNCNEGPGPVKPAQTLLDAGYAVLGVNIRGTGCSGGQLDVRNAVHDRDGVETVEWSARQPWSTGHIGMFGDSFPGVTQPGIAALHPKGLDAIAPWQITDDLYRDVAYPGGLPNAEFGAFWGLANQPAAGATSIDQGAQEGDAQCAANVAQQAPSNPPTNIFVAGKLHPYFDSYWKPKAVGAKADEIDVPAFGCQTWQDDELGSLSTWTLFPRLDPARTWLVASNGYHSMCQSPKPIRDQLVRFFDRFVKGEQNGFESTPHMQIWHETAGIRADAKPAWVTSSESWPPRTETDQLYLSGDSALTAARPSGNQPADDYVSPTVSAGTENGTVAGQQNKLWKIPGDPSGARAYTTPKLGRDVELLGPASIDLWLKSTSTDTNLQATITEVRPDGQEVYVNRGWLQASHRTLDERASTPTLPVNTHLEADAKPLTPGEPTFMRFAVFPFDHVFRAGSRIRLIIDTPSQTGGWNFEPLANAGENSILHDAEHPSRLVVGTVPGGRAPGGYSACDTLLNQPCRADAFTDSDPSGTLQWPADDTGATLPPARAIRACKRRKAVRIRLRAAPRHDKLTSAVFAIDGKTVKKLRGRKLRRVVTLRKLPAKAFRLTVTLRTKKGKTFRSARRYGACS